MNHNLISKINIAATALSAVINELIDDPHYGVEAEVTEACTSCIDEMAQVIEDEEEENYDEEDHDEEAP